MPNLRKLFLGRKPKSLPSGFSKKDRQRHKSLKGMKPLKKPAKGGAKPQSLLSIDIRQRLLTPKLEEFMRSKTAGRSLLHSHMEAWSLSRPLTVLFEAITEGLPREAFDKPLNEIFTEAVKQKGIKSIAEVGAGETGILTEANALFANSGIERYSIGGMSEREARLARSLGIKVVPEFAGNLGNKHKGKFGLVVASNVFSFGGSDVGFEMDAIPKTFSRNTKAVVDLIGTLSNNPNARIVLTEIEDALCIDRKEIEKHARILKWEQAETPNSRHIRNMDFISLDSRKPWYTQEYVRMRKEAPNRVVLAPKRR